MIFSAKKRKKPKRMILVNRDLQFRYMWIALIIGTVSTLLCSIVILYPLYEFEILRIKRFLPLPVLSGMAFSMILNLFFILVLSIIITHRIAGPMFALSREFAEISQHIFGRELQLRKNDDLRYLIRSFNEMSLHLKNMTFDDLEQLEEMQKKVQELLAAEQKGDQIQAAPEKTSAESTGAESSGAEETAHPDKPQHHDDDNVADAQKDHNENALERLHTLLTQHIEDVKSRVRHLDAPS